MIHTIKPIVDSSSKILIVGTFPSVKSREANFYYHNPQNRFWKVISSLVGEPIPTSIEAKTEMLLKHHIAVWDVIYSCDITGSSDNSIQNVVPNDIRKLLQETNIKYIYANGNKADGLYMRYCFANTGIATKKLPSTSPANATYTLDRLIDCWSREIQL